MERGSLPGRLLESYRKATALPFAVAQGYRKATALRFAVAHSGSSPVGYRVGYRVPVAI